MEAREAASREGLGGQEPLLKQRWGGGGYLEMPSRQTSSDTEAGTLPCFYPSCLLAYNHILPETVLL